MAAPPPDTALMIDWLVQTEADLPALPAEVWLSPPEQERFAALRVEKKRREWLLGRWTAKRLVQAVLLREGHGRIEPAAISITPAPDGAPELRPTSPDADRVFDAALGALRVTISHSHGRAFCALGPDDAPVGADIELVAPRHASFPGDYFTGPELALVGAAPAALRDTLVTAIWSAKEAVLKALRRGLTVDTRLVECLVPAVPGTRAAWESIAARCDPSLGAADLRCWWRADGAYVLTLAIDVYLPGGVRRAAPL